MYTDVTKQDSEILVPYITDKNSKDYRRYKTLSSGIVLSGQDIYSISDGIVILVGEDESKLSTVIVQYNLTQCFSYCLLTSTYVNANDIVTKGTKLGTCKNKMRFEYLTSSKDNSIWARRIDDLVYYPQNPTEVLNGNIELDSKITLYSGFNTQTVFGSTP